MIIGKYTIELQPMTWWDQQEIQALLANGAKMNNNAMSGFDGNVLLDSKMKTLEKSIKNITDEEGKYVPFSDEWVKGLSVAEGEELENAIEELNKKK